MESSIGLWSLTPFGVDRGAEDIILLLLLVLLLLPAFMQMWVGSLLPRSVDALLYNRGHIFFRNLVHRVSIGTYALLGGLPVSYTHLTLPTILRSCRSRWSPYH